MPDSQQHFLDLMEEVRAGSQDAIGRLVDTYGEHIYRIIRRRMNAQLRTQFDSQDFAQAVWVSFFSNETNLGRFQHPADLAAFLGVVAGNKVVDEIRRRFLTQKNNVNRERRVDAGDADQGYQVAANWPTPSEVAVANEQMDRLTAGQPPQYQQVVQMRADGLTYKEIADAIGMDEKTVRRVIKRLSGRIQK